MPKASRTKPRRWQNTWIVEGYDRLTSHLSKEYDLPRSIEPFLTTLIRKHGKDLRWRTWDLTPAQVGSIAGQTKLAIQGDLDFVLVCRRVLR